MNKCELIGRFTRDLTLGTSSAGNYTRFTLAVNRPYKKDGKNEADFINCVAFKGRAEFLCNYFRQGDPVAIIGHIQTGSYTNKDGAKVYTTEIIVDECEFVAGAKKSDADAGTPKPENANDFLTLTEGELEELPFK